MDSSTSADARADSTEKRAEDGSARIKSGEHLRRLKAAASNHPAEERTSFREAIRPYLSRLRRLARFERAHLWARRQVTSDYPSADDLMDEVLARAYRDPDLLKDPKYVESKLFRILVDVAKEEASHDLERRRTISMEIKPPREPTDREIDETFYDWFQPDEVTKVEDIAADRSPNPEEVVMRNEMRQRFASIFASLPAAWCRAIILTRVEGMPLATVARILNTSEDEVRKWLDHADKFIRARLADEDIVPSDPDELSYLAEAPLLEDSEIAAGFDTALESREQDEAPMGR
jgi:RNA polymerase sigma factor (sigma-70 family)